MTNAPIWYTREQDNDSKLRATLRLGKGRLMDLTEATDIELYVITPDMRFKFGGAILDGAKAIVEFTPALTVAGTFEAYILVKSGTNKEQSFPNTKNFTIVCHPRD